MSQQENFNQSVKNINQKRKETNFLANKNRHYW